MMEFTICLGVTKYSKEFNWEWLEQWPLGHFLGGWIVSLGFMRHCSPNIACHRVLSFVLDVSHSRIPKNEN